ncbi:unnamed protein product, partial [Durusdinium trenchii]
DEAIPPPLPAPAAPPTPAETEAELQANVLASKPDKGKLVSYAFIVERDAYYVGLLDM